MHLKAKSLTKQMRQKAIPMFVNILLVKTLKNRR